MNNWNIKKLMIVGFTAPLLIIILMGINSVAQFRHASQRVEMLATSDTPLLIAINQITSDTLRNRRYEKDFFINIGNPEKQEKYLQKYAIQKQKTLENIIKVQGLIQKDEELSDNIATLAKELTSDITRYFNLFSTIAQKVKADPSITPSQANQMLAPAKKNFHSFEKNLDTIRSAIKAMFQATVLDTTASATQGRNIIIYTVLATFILVIVISTFIIKTINGKLQQAVTTLDQSAGQTNTIVVAMSSGSQALAEGATEQAASIEETSSAVEELASQTRQNSDNASEANNLMKDTMGVVNRAVSSMEELTTSMNDITRASEETSKIIKTIDEIAFQTNLLALNAAVEAARAGEAGAGFAVVADEVRNLAMRAAEAASTTSGLIEQTGNRVKTGAILVDRTTEEFNAVAENTGKIGTLINEISVASAEQAEGVHQINSTITEMDGLIQQTAASSEETAASTTEVVQQSQVVQRVVDALARMAGITARDSHPQPTRSPAPVPSQRTQVQQITPATNKPKTLPPAQPTKAEEVIPFDDDDFEDF